MSIVLWSNSELRAFILTVDRLRYGDDAIADLARADFRTQVVARIAPAIRSTMLARAGVLLSAEGIGLLVCDVLEDARYDEADRRAWLLVCADPWSYLTEWMMKVVNRSYRATVGRRAKSQRDLDGIAAASARRAIESTPGE